MKKPYNLTGGAALAALALGSPTLRADLVGQWLASDYTTGGDWTSTAATGSIVATGGGSGEAVTDGYAAGMQGVDTLGSEYFIVSAGDNPLAGATEMTIAAIIKPFSPGTVGRNFYEGSGIVGMEIGGVTSDWGFGWNGNRLAATAAQAGVLERSIFSPPLPANNEFIVAMYTWSNGVQKLFVNGVEVNSQEVGSYSPRLEAAFSIGAMTGMGANVFDGQFGEVRLYDSDESANAATIASTLLGSYAGSIVLEKARINPTGGTFVLVDTAAAEVDASGTFSLSFNGTAVDSGDVQVSKAAGRTTVTFLADVGSNGALNGYDLTVPLVGGGDRNYTGDLGSPILPTTIPGQEGSVGSWGISEILTGAAPLPANPTNIATAVDAVLAETFTAQASAPVFNHRDPDTNDTNNAGNFNNDFPILVNAADGQDFVVVGKTTVNIATPGEIHTFSVHSDDGFAMRVSGPGGGRFLDYGGDASIDAADAQTLYRDGGTGDSNSRGIYQFDAAGQYEITYLGWDGAGGGYYEVAWAPGTHYEDRDTNLWSLVGDDSSLPAFVERFVTNPPGIPAEAGSVGITTYLNSGATDLGNGSTFLATTTRSYDDGFGDTIGSQEPYINHRDVNNGANYVFGQALPFPGDNPTVDENNVVTVAKARISIPSAGTYTFLSTADDGHFVRFLGVDGAPDPSIRRVTAAVVDPRFQMSNPNEVYFYGAGQSTRTIIDLDAGSYDIEYVTVENGGGFAYELGVAAGEWPYLLTPPGGFQLLGASSETVTFPTVAAPGWTVESSLPGLNQFNFNIAGAEAKISYTQGLATDAPEWTTLGLDPADRETIWDVVDFRDPEDGPEGAFTPSNPWPLNTPAADNDYALRATGIINITDAGYYHLGFRGDDGGYMYLYGEGGNDDPDIDSIVSTFHPTVATIATAPGSVASNAVNVEVGTGDSYTLIRTFLEAGQYRIVTLMYEGGGGSFWEVFGGSESTSFNYPLLSTTAMAAVTTNDSLSLLAQPIVTPGNDNFVLTNVAVAGTTVSFDIGSQTGESYTIQASTNLIDWEDVATGVAATGTSTPFSVDLTGTSFEGEPKVFFQAVVE